MPSEEAHIRLAIRNQTALDYLATEVDKYAEWVATVAFYKALHVVEAVFARDKAIGHGRDHGPRHQYLKRNNRYQHIWKNYWNLWRASTVARYLEDNGHTHGSFAEYMTPDQVVDRLIKGNLHRVQMSARKFLSPASVAALGLPPVRPKS